MGNHLSWDDFLLLRNQYQCILNKYGSGSDHSRITTVNCKLRRQITSAAHLKYLSLRLPLPHRCADDEPFWSMEDHECGIES